MDEDKYLEIELVLYDLARFMEESGHLNKKMISNHKLDKILERYMRRIVELD